MSTFFHWVDTNQVLSAILLLTMVAIAGGWSSRHKMLAGHLQAFVKTLGSPPWDNEYNIANVEIGKHYAITIAHKETVFLVKSISERFAAFEVVVTPVNPAETTPQGAKAHGWAFKIDHVGVHSPKLYASAFAAGRAMEQRLSVGNSKRAHA